MGVIAGPFGLFGFALATIVLNMANAKIFPLNSMNLAMGLACGAGLQGVGALIALFQGHFLGSLAFFSYAFFWISYVLIFVLQSAPVPAVAVIAGTNTTAAAATFLRIPPPSPLALGLYLFVWMLFSIGMTICIWRPKSSWALRITFITVDFLFALLIIADFLKAAGEKDIGDIAGKIAGIEGIFCGFCALYTGMAEVINPTYGRSILPLGEVEAPPAKKSSVPLTEIRTDPNGASTEEKTRLTSNQYA